MNLEHCQIYFNFGILLSIYQKQNNYSMQRIQNGQFTLNPQDYYSSGQVRKQLNQVGKIISKSLSKSGQTFREQLHKISPLKGQQQMHYQIREDQKIEAESYINQEQPLNKKRNLKQNHERLINNKANTKQNKQTLCQDEISQCFNNQQYPPLQSSGLKTSFRISRLSNHSSFLKQKKDIGKISNKSLLKVYMSQSQLIDDSKSKGNKQKSPGFLTQRNKQEQNYRQIELAQISSKVQKQLHKKEQQLKRLLQRNSPKTKKTKSHKITELPSVNKINKNILKFRQFVSKTNDNSPQQILNKTSQKLYYVFSQSPVVIQTDRLKQIKFHKNSSKYLEGVYLNQNQDSPLKKINLIQKRKNRFNMKQANKEKQLKKQQIPIQKYLQEEDFMQKIHLKSRVKQTFSIQTNKNRKPLSVNQLIDVYPQQKLFSQAQQIKNQFSEFFKYFMFLKEIQKQQNQQGEKIFFTTKISNLKTLLIDLDKDSKPKIAIPNILIQKYLNETFMQNLRQMSTLDLHNIFQILLNQIKNSSKLVKVKKYQNCIYISAKKVQKNVVSLPNAVFALIWHFSGNIYLGDWIEDASEQTFQQKNNEDQSSFNNLNKINSGFRNGIGLQIRLLKQKAFANQYKGVIDIYFGQFKKNQRQGYGVRANLTQSSDNTLEQQIINKKINQKLEIGCWQNNLKHGWIKTFLNKQLIQNAEYSSNAFVKCKPQKQKQKISSQIKENQVQNQKQVQKQKHKEIQKQKQKQLKKQKPNQVQIQVQIQIQKGK